MITLISLLLIGQTAVQKPLGWSVQKLKAGIEISAPVPLAKSVQKVDDPGIASQETYIGESGKVTFVVSIAELKDLSDAPTGSLFTGSVSADTADPSVVITGEKDLLTQGWPGLAITGRHGDGTTIASRYYRFRDVLISTNCVFPTNMARPTTVDSFLDSVKFPAEGALKVAGPVLTRLSLGNLLLSALLPGESEEGTDSLNLAGTECKATTFTSSYASRAFSIVILDRTKNDPADETRQLEISDTLLKRLKAKLVKRSDDAIGKEKALRTEYALPGGKSGIMLTTRLGTQYIVCNVEAPSVYEDPKVVEQFLHSLQVEVSAPDWTVQVLDKGVKVAAPQILDKSTKAIKDRTMLDLDTWVARRGRNIYVVGISTLKETEKASTGDILTNTAGGFMPKEKSTIIGEKDLLQQGWHGLAITVRSESNIVVAARIYRVGATLVLISGTYLASDGRSPDIDRFLDSLQLPPGGTATISGPELNRFDLGSTGVSVLMPKAPHPRDSEFQRKGKKFVLHNFDSSYCFRLLTISCADLPPEIVTGGTPQQWFEAESQLIDEALASLKATKTKQKDDVFGKDTGLSAEFRVKNIATGKIAVFPHGSKLVMGLIVGPQPYQDPKLVDLVLHSIEFKN